VRSAFANRAISLVVLAVAIAVAAGLAVWKHTVTLAASAPQPQPQAEPVNTVLRACPAPGLTGEAAAQVALIAGPSATGSGRALVTRLGAAAGGTPLASFTQPEALSVTAVRPVPAPARGKKSALAHSATPSPAPTSPSVATVPVPGGTVIQATGAMARGLEAEQVSDSGRAAARCAGPGTDFWFAGPGVFTAPHIQVFLMNVSGQPADATVQAFTDAGPLQGSTDTGIAVAPHSMVRQSLDKMLHGTRMVALQVRTSVGQVVAAVRETRSGRAGAWLPVSAAPATRIVIPGMPATAGTRQLFLSVPGTSDAHITLNAITHKGSYRPTGGGGLDIPGGSVAQISLTSLSGVYGALVVSSTAPVTASLMVPGGQRGAPGAFTAAAPAIQEQGVVAVNVTGKGAASSLVLSAPWRGARVRLTEIGTGGGQDRAAPGSVLVIPAHRSLVEQLPTPAGSRRGYAFAVVVTPLPGSGPVYAGRVITTSGRGGAVESILPVPSALTVVRLPPVQGALLTPGG
jgi:uncharacterized protein DUF5719